MRPMDAAEWALALGSTVAVFCFVGGMVVFHRLGIANQQACISLLMTTSLSVGTAAGVIAYVRVEGGSFLRGAKVLSGKEAEEVSHRELAKRSGEWFSWGGIKVPLEAKHYHGLIVGVTGQGKTTLLKPVMQVFMWYINRLSVLPVGDPRRKTCRGTRALIYDGKTDLLPVLYGMNLCCELYLINPRDRRTAGWDLAADLDGDDEAAEELIWIIIPERNESDIFFSQAARMILKGILFFFMNHATRDPETGIPQWDLLDVVNATRNDRVLKSILSGNEDSKHLIARYFETDAKKTTDNIMMTLDTCVGRYKGIADAFRKAKKKVSLRHWLQNEYIIVLGNDETARAQIDLVTQAFFHRATQLALGQPGKPDTDTDFFLDEQREAGKFEKLQKPP